MTLTEDSRKEQTPGIPADATVDRIRQWVIPRVSAKRLRHIEGVVQVARELAHRAGESALMAELAGWLHDSCKEVKDKELLEQAKRLQVPLDEMLIEFAHLLHGPVAAGVAREEFRITNFALLDAIAEHTLGAVPMSRISQVVFLADCLEESRPAEYKSAIWDALNEDSNSCNLSRAMYVASNLNLQVLIATGKPIHPRTVQVRNYFLKRTSYSP